MTKVTAINGRTCEWDFHNGYEGLITKLGAYPRVIETDEPELVKDIIGARLIPHQNERGTEYHSVFMTVDIKQL